MRNAAKHSVARTFFGPDTKAKCPLKSKAAYFRRHRNSYACDGKTVAQWYPKLPERTLVLPRSLVGMTQSSRKRYARKWEAPRDHQLRIGERLRLCPGCKVCGFAPRVKMWRLHKGRWRSGSLAVLDIKHICDGSGVLAARKKGGR